ncbi:chemotaxis protein CheW [Methylosinus sp. Sm6]|uniref:chemotaxis protein CheW n=1 Tax=Methylosinus sp. Sm6 TaxID=2866948 RepID=UPI001C9A0729|nr:chemotaxis protein CheW [Methylosinus sp. Sm6]MBY6242657.1 chemotaxis protein CheW [Methylosinus sp. Sm6]
MAQETIDESRQCLMLGVGGEIFAIDAERVREILDPAPVTEVPGARDFVRGLINVRGKVVPMADLRPRFGMEVAEATPDTRFVVIEVDLDGEPTVVGIVADKVYEVAELPLSSLGAAPRIGMRWRPELVKFIGRWQDDFIVVPDIERIFN